MRWSSLLWSGIDVHANSVTYTFPVMLNEFGLMRDDLLLNLPKQMI